MTDRAPPVLVDPAFAIDGRDLSDFLAEFGPSNGRYVPRFPAKWKRRLLDRLEQLTPVARQAAKRRIECEADLCTTPVSWPWSDDLSWTDNAVSLSTTTRPGLVVGDALEPGPFKAWPEALEEIRQGRTRSWRFDGTVSEYVRDCRALLVNSTTAYLIDPYLDPLSNESEVFLRSLFAEMKGSRCYAIELIMRWSNFGRDPSSKGGSILLVADAQDRLSGIYGDIVPVDRHLRVNLVIDGEAGGEHLNMHDRYFMTEHGGINFGHGFLLRAGRAPGNDAYILDRAHHQEKKQIYIDGIVGGKYGQGVKRPKRVAKLSLTGRRR